MLGKQSEITVVGAGAIGGVTAALMKLAGYKVDIVCKYSELAEVIKNKGFAISGMKGDHQVSMPAVADISELEGKKDIVFLATKATDMMDAAEKLLPFLKENSLVVSMQNGICEESLAEVLDKKRVIGCVVAWGATMHAQGELEVTSMGDFAIGNIIDIPTERLGPVRDMLQKVAPVTISTNIMGNLYSKLIINSCITSLGAVCGLYMGEMLKNRKIRNIFIEIMYEAMAVADAMDLKVEMISKLDYYRFLGGKGLLSQLWRHLIIKMMGFKYRRLKSSSLQSLERGKPTEILFLNGYIQKKGKEYQIDTPVNDKVIEIVQDIEAGKKQISISNFDDTVFDEF